MSATADATELLEQIMGYRVTQAIYVAAKLGIADPLETGPRSAAAVAQSLAVPEDSVHRVLRALSSAGIFKETDNGLFALAPAGSLLRSDSADSLRAAAIFFGDHRHWTLWSKLIDAVTTGRPIRRADDDAFAQRSTSDPEGAAIFNSAMSALTSPVHAGVLAAYDFLQTIVDVGGGHGALIASILSRYPSLRGILFDIPAVIEGANANPSGRAGVPVSTRSRRFLQGGSLWGRRLHLEVDHSRLGRRANAVDTEHMPQRDGPRRQAAHH
jgi:hypothetical protein